MIPSLFCHVTVVPAETVRVPGLNTIFIMTTVLGGGGFEDPELLPYGFDESLLQPKSPANAAPKAADASQMSFFSWPLPFFAESASVSITLRGNAEFQLGAAYRPFLRTILVIYLPTIIVIFYLTLSLNLVNCLQTHRNYTLVHSIGNPVRVHLFDS